ncbi:NAD(P)/FAD-dependent oxidoreductase [Rossellomorea marisflavi]|uniref:flavin-containing monooxygenase n=1 Tax=Rossellomorea marisflavi TaxID=189381 RepID=UPI00296F0D78|nr:NAD(P)/FAD-dependent oxidoreductase [Rossellomorea marisflavi]MDW4525402.1 NAD(P)/FAD-dependent oxidoreductase [Rossellomorea marisflavi]
MYDIIVVGGGQAGLAMGYYIKKSGGSFLILDQAISLGESWRKRYDSLKLFTPRSLSSLPGLLLRGKETDYPGKDEVASYLEEYAKTFDLPVKLNTTVGKVEQVDGVFRILTNQGTLLAKQVVVATGPFQTPVIPGQARPGTIHQLHSSSYRNADQLVPGEALVVGGGNSGAQIAVELAETRTVYLSVGSKMKFLPQDVAGKSIFWWFKHLGVLSVTSTSRLGKFIQKQPDPIFGKELRELIRQGKVIVKPRFRDMEEERVAFEDGTAVEVSNIVWATGFKQDFDWISVNGALDLKGKPIHHRGVSPVKGLYFIGQPWQHRRGSALLQGVGEDARYLYGKIIK